ncbi:MAG: TetR/AcrR family transcriptional regulator [Clostridia bacterium]|nr:TetR/AcrR family transcriptional regulator [Clostridia bacterium]
MSNRKLCKGLQERNAELKKITQESITRAMLLLMENNNYDDISVTMLCTKAGISRNAFYKNFETKENVFKKIVIDYNKNLLRKLGSPFRDKVSIEWYIEYFKEIQSTSDFLKLLIKTNLQNMYLELVNHLLTYSSKISPETKYTRLMWNGAIQNITITWIKNGMVLTPEEIANIFYNKMNFKNKKSLLSFNLFKQKKHPNS